MPKRELFGNIAELDKAARYLQSVPGAKNLSAEDRTKIKTGITALSLQSMYLARHFIGRHNGRKHLRDGKSLPGMDDAMV